MNGKKVEISLNTPILIELPEEGGQRGRIETVLRINGTVSAFSEAGIQLEVSGMTNQRDQKVTASHKSLFLPHHKIDHVFII